MTPADDEAAEIVKKIFDMFAYDKLSLRAVDLRLNDMGGYLHRNIKRQGDNAEQPWGKDTFLALQHN